MGGEHDQWICTALSRQIKRIGVQDKVVALALHLDGIDRLLPTVSTLSTTGSGPRT